MTPSRRFDLMMKFESEGLPEEEMVELFQELVNTRMAWQLQGFYGRHAMRLIDAGLVHLPNATKPEKPEGLDGGKVQELARSIAESWDTSDLFGFAVDKLVEDMSEWSLAEFCAEWELHMNEKLEKSGDES